MNTTLYNKVESLKNRIKGEKTYYNLLTNILNLKDYWDSSIDSDMKDVLSYLEDAPEKEESKGILSSIFGSSSVTKKIYNDFLTDPKSVVKGKSKDESEKLYEEIKAYPDPESILPEKFKNHFEEEKKIKNFEDKKKYNDEYKETKKKIDERKELIKKNLEILLSEINKKLDTTSKSFSLEKELDISTIWEPLKNTNKYLKEKEDLYKNFEKFWNEADNQFAKLNLDLLSKYKSILKNKNEEFRDIEKDIEEFKTEVSKAAEEYKSKKGIEEGIKKEIKKEIIKKGETIVKYEAKKIEENMNEIEKLEKEANEKKEQILKNKKDIEEKKEKEIQERQKELKEDKKKYIEEYGNKYVNELLNDEIKKRINNNNNPMGSQEIKEFKEKQLKIFSAKDDEELRKIQEDVVNKTNIELQKNKLEQEEAEKKLLDINNKRKKLIDETKKIQDDPSVVEFIKNQLKEKSWLMKLLTNKIAMIVIITIAITIIIILIITWLFFIFIALLLNYSYQNRYIKDAKLLNVTVEFSYITLLTRGALGPVYVLYWLIKYGFRFSPPPGVYVMSKLEKKVESQS